MAAPAANHGVTHIDCGSVSLDNSEGLYCCPLNSVECCGSACSTIPDGMIGCCPDWSPSETNALCKDIPSVYSFALYDGLE